MLPNLLRSVIPQVSRVGRSVVSRRNLSSSPRIKESKRPRRRDVPAGGLITRDKFEFFGSSLVFGYCAFIACEIIQLVEYRRTIEKAMEKPQAKTPRDLLRWLLKD